MIDKIPEILKKWVNLDFFRGSWGRLVCERAPAIFESLYSGDPGKQTAFASAHYEVTNRCNAKCVHCQRWNWQDTTDPPLAEAISTLTILQQLGVQTVTIGGGEPFLYPDLPTLISKGKDIGLRLGIITNGLHLPQEIIPILCSQVEWVRFSLDATNAASYELIRGVPGGFERVVRNLKRLLAARQESSATTQIGINFVIQKANLHAIPQIIRFAEENQVDTVLFKMVHGEGPYLLDFNDLTTLRQLLEKMISSGGYATNTNLREFLVSITEEAVAEDIVSGYPLRSFYLQENMRCFAPFFFLAIDSHGFFYPCEYLFFDTRDEDNYQESRTEYRIGYINELKNNKLQIMNNLQLILEKLSKIDTISLPECGCCTRFYRFNKMMNQLYLEYCRLRESHNYKEVAEIFSIVINSQKGKYGWL